MLDIRVVRTLADVDRGAWSALFPGEIETYDYLTAVERAGLQGFDLRYVLAFQGADLVAAAPAFFMAYPLETTLTGVSRRLAGGLRKVLPGAMTLRLACLGSPCTETAVLGVAAQVPPAARAALVRDLLAGFEAAAREARCNLLGLKDVADPEQALWLTGAAASGYRAIPSLPTAHLDIDFASLDDYLARLSAGARRDMRRKLRALGRVRVEVRHEIDDVVDRVMALYEETRARAEFSLEALTRDYFVGVLRGMPGRAFMALYFEGDDLLAANLLLQDGATLLDKYFCMDAARGRPLNLYFLSWFTNVRLCLEHGWTRYQSGQAAYEAKLRLGSRLSRTANCFRHRNVLVNGVLQLAAPLFAADRTLEAAA